MPGPRLIPLEPEGIPPRGISPRLRSQLVYFGEHIPDDSAAPGSGEYRFEPSQVEAWLDDGVISLVSPLDTANTTEVELSEEQEALLEWLKAHRILRARVEE